MNKQAIVLLCAFLAIQVSAMPRAIIDEAKQQLQELESLVRADITVAHDNLQDMEVDFVTYSDTTAKDGAVSIQQEHETIIAQLTTIKELAHQANKNISACTDIREEVLHRLPAVYTEQMVHCIRGHDIESARLLNSSRYLIDIAIGKVHELQHQLNRCQEDDLLCIQPILSEIELEMVRLPNNIKTEVNAAQALLTTLRNSIQECADVKISEYASDANSIFQDISSCVNRIIN